MSRRRTRSFGIVRKLPSGRWQARYHDQAGVRHTAPRTFPTRGDANRFLAQVEADLLRGSWADPKLGRVPFGEWVEQWRPTTANLRPGTLVLYDYLLRRFLLPAFEQVPLGRYVRFHPDDVDEYVAAHRIEPASGAPVGAG